MMPPRILLLRLHLCQHEVRGESQLIAGRRKQRSGRAGDISPDHYVANGERRDLMAEEFLASMQPEQQAVSRQAGQYKTLPV